jgi:type III pantothenate kinase
MTTPSPHPDDAADRPSLPALVALAIGNSRTRVGAFRGRELVEAVSLANSDPAAIAERALAAADQTGAERVPPVVLASVNPAMTERLRPLLAERGLGGMLEVRKDIPLPIRHTLEEGGEKTVGVDRLLGALGAFHRSRQACVVIDAGTAITVDFIDGEGVFHGGAIAPGLRMMLHALHGGTALLPEVAFEPVGDDRPFGKNTAEAMRLGVLAAARGLVRELTERYAVFYEGYPQVVATGGDCAIFENDGLVEHLVPDLQLLGIHAACERALGEDDDESDED